MLEKYKWPHIHKDIQEHVRACKICLKSGDKLINTKNFVIRPQGPNDIWVVDLIGRIPGKNNSNKFIFVGIDHYTKWIETAIMDRKDASTTSELIQTLIIDKHGIPNKIFSDNGLECANKGIQELCAKTGSNGHLGHQITIKQLELLKG